MKVLERQVVAWDDLCQSELENQAAQRVQISTATSLL